MQEGLRYFADNDSASGLARGLAMASIIQFHHGDPEFGVRLAAAAYDLVREQDVMLGPVKVLHLPDPAVLAADYLGADEAEARLEPDAAPPRSVVIAEVFAAAAPTRRSAPTAVG
jgi:hypothetical protein